MTTRNLNKTWVDVIKAQYKQDFSDNVPFPVKYLLHNPQWKADFYYEIPVRIEPDKFKRSILDFAIYTRQRETADFEDENIKVWKRVSKHVPSPNASAQDSDEVVQPKPSSAENPKPNAIQRRRKYIEEKLAVRAAAASS